MTSSTKSVLDYQQKALESIPKDHPYKDEIIKLLNEQVKDDLSQSNAHTLTNR
jgi:hypothetical protein